MTKKKTRPKKGARNRGEPQPCHECGRPGEYYTDSFGMISDLWRCGDCHEQALRRLVRSEFQTRYGDR